MHSRPGKSTINYYKVFQVLSKDRPYESGMHNPNSGSSANRHRKLLESLALVPEDALSEKVLQNIDQADVELLGKIAAEGKQQLVIDKLERMIMAQKHSELVKAQPDSQGGLRSSNAKTNSPKAEKAAAQGGEDENDYLAEQIDMYQNKISAKPGQQ